MKTETPRKPDTIVCARCRERVRRHRFYRIPADHACPHGQRCETREVAARLRGVPWVNDQRPVCDQCAAPHQEAV